jgi:hypothetical protein
MLNGFEAISVRERDGVALVRELADVEAAWLPDPTLLFDAAFYAQLAPSRNDTRRRSLFKYFIGGETDALRSFDELLKKELALDEISSDARWAKGWLGRSLRLNDRLHVSQWLGRMRDCTCVVTNSFHGTVFAIINRKPFVTFLQSGPAAAMNNRLVSLLHRLSLSDRLLPCINQTVLCDLLTRKIEWGEVSQRIAEWQHESDRFLAAAEL